ncbi:MAG TPA: heavy metal-associated domain-containing protein [Candidatus Eisenbacteria bacterium]|nr:heavy metal-associated domain-containing protein [Candidatus Eisenbacteria bacterium]
MKRMNVLAALSMVTLLTAATAYAGGAACSGESEASAKACKVGTTAKMAGAGGHCDMGKGASAMAEGKSCTLGANQMVYSFAVPTAECDNCAEGITKALMAQKGIHCAHVDLKARVAYIVADKKMDKNSLAKCIQTAGFKNSYRGDGKNVRAEFTKMLTVADSKGAACCATKAKDKV